MVFHLCMVFQMSVFQVKVLGGVYNTTILSPLFAGEMISSESLLNFCL